MEPSSGQEPPRWPKDGPKRPQEGPKRPPRGPKMAPRRPQDGPKAAPSRPQGASNNHRTLTSFGITAKSPPKGPQDPPKRPPEPPKGPPGSPLEAPRTLPGGPLEAPGTAQQASKMPPRGMPKVKGLMGTKGIFLRSQKPSNHRQSRRRPPGCDTFLARTWAFTLKRFPFLVGTRAWSPSSNFRSISCAFLCFHLRIGTTVNNAIDRHSLPLVQSIARTQVNIDRAAGGLRYAQCNKSNKH